MLVCICKGVSDRRINEAMREGARSLEQIQSCCQAGTDCGMCVRKIRKMLLSGAAAAHDDAGKSSP